jgi:Protein of unknown function (DUF1579)
MARILTVAVVAAAWVVAAPPGLSAQTTGGQPAGPAAAQQEMPNWVRRGLPGRGHAALEPLIGTWRVRKSIYGTMGRSPDQPPIISEDITTRRDWVADGHYIQDTTEGTVDGKPYWRRGWLGYSNMDRRYEWVTIDPPEHDHDDLPRQAGVRREDAHHPDGRLHRPGSGE